MNGFSRIFRIGLVGLAMLATAAVSQADPVRVIASNGAVISMPEVSGLSCAQMAEVLYLLDLSNYRGPEPLKRDDPDYPIFDYEDRLTQRHYYDCMLGASQLEDPGAAFSFGFSSQ